MNTYSSTHKKTQYPNGIISKLGFVILCSKPAYVFFAESQIQYNALILHPANLG